MPRAPDEGPSTSSRGQESRSPGEQLVEEQARSTAMREEAGFERGAGAVRPSPKDPSVQGTTRSAVDPAALATFAQDLLAGSEVGETLDGGVDAEELGELDVELEVPEQERRTRKPRAARAPRQAHGGVDEPEAGEANPGEGGPAPDDDRSRRWPRVSARRRVKLLDLARLLRRGEEEQVLVGWQAKTVTSRVHALTSRGFHLLRTAIDRLEGDLHRLVLLQAVGAHRTPDDLVLLADALASVTDDALATWLRDRIATRDPAAREAPGPAPPPALLQDHYDPCVRWLDEAPHVPQPSEEWPVPRWLRGAPREALELCAVAFLQSAGGVLGEREDEGLDGADDPLVAALELHGEAHPAIARWGLHLAARADDAAGLDCAADALLRGRASLGGAD